MKTLKENVKVTRKEENAIIKSFESEAASLGGAIKILKTIATRDKVKDMFKEENCKYSKEKEEIFWNILQKADIFHIAKESLENVGGIYAKAVVFGKKDNLHPENNYDKIKGINRPISIEPIKSLDYKPFGYKAKHIIYKYDTAQISFIQLVNTNKENTATTFKCFVKLEKFTPKMIIKAIISYMNAGCPEIAPVKPRAKKEKKAPAKKETAPAQTGKTQTA